MTVDTYNVDTGWNRDDDGFGDSYDVNKTYREHGLNVYDQIGHECGSGATIWQREGLDEGFIVELNTVNSGRSIHVPNLPSLFALMKMMAPYIALQMQTEFFEDTREIHTLLTEYACGPLEEQLRERREEQRRNRAYRKEQEEKAKQKAQEANS